MNKYIRVTKETTFYKENTEPLLDIETLESYAKNINYNNDGITYELRDNKLLILESGHLFKEIEFEEQ